nr:MAG TPA: hypothetical protein [Caudoviricetes sp.]
MRRRRTRTQPQLCSLRQQARTLVQGRRPPRHPHTPQKRLRRLRATLPTAPTPTAKPASNANNGAPKQKAANHTSRTYPPAP